MRAALQQHLSTLVSLRIVRYGLSAGLATVADVGVFALLIYLVLEREAYHVLGLRFNTEDWALIFSYSTGVVVHFLGSKLFVFNESSTHTRVQFTRFLVVAVVVYFANRLLLDLLITAFTDWFSAFFSSNLIKVGARAVAIVSVGLASFMTHKFYTFRDSPA